MRIDNGRYREVVMDWSNITPPLKAGTPIAADGTVSNDGDAIGIVPVAVAAQTVMPRSIFILDAGDVDLEEVETESGLTIAAEAKAAMPAVHFHHADGTVDDYASGGGSGGASGLLVTATVDEDTTTLDKTYEEIAAAINNGVVPMIVTTGDDGVRNIEYVYTFHSDPDNGDTIETANYAYVSEDGVLTWHDTNGGDAGIMA